MTEPVTYPCPAGFINYPTPEAHAAPYKAPPTSTNPALRGFPIRVLAELVSFLPPLQRYLWHNAGFACLREIPELQNGENRYDPAVIPIASKDENPARSLTKDVNLRVPPRDLSSRYYTVVDFHDAYKNGRLTPSEVVEALLPIIRRDVNNRHKHSVAFVDTQIELVRAAAEASTQRYKEERELGMLDGVPFAVKDEMDVKGYGRTVGTKHDYSHAQTETSWCVRKLEEEGAVCMGKLNMHELGLDTTNNNPNLGTPLNPHNEHYYTGGSSGGAAYAVANGIVPFAIGSDGGGSIRIPSAYCGVFGLKPSHGRVSSGPLPAFANTTVVQGPLAGNMADLEISFRVLGQSDPSGSHSRQFPPTKPLPSGQKKVLGIYKHWFDRADPSVREVCQKALDHFKSELGYEIVNITLPYVHEGQLAHAMTILNECLQLHPATGEYTAPNKILLSIASQTSARDFLLAQALRSILMKHLAYLFQKHPGLIIVTPTTPNAGWHISGGATDLKYGISDGNTQVRNMEYVWLANFCGLPCISFPVGYVDPVEGDGKIPIGLSGNGEWGREDLLLEFGYDGESWVNGKVEGGRRRPGDWVDVLDVGEGKDGELSS